MSETCIKEKMVDEMKEILLDRLHQLTVKNNMMQEALEEIEDYYVNHIRDAHEIKRLAMKALEDIRWDKIRHYVQWRREWTRN